MEKEAQALSEYVREGSEAAFGVLVREHIDMVYGTAFRILNADRQLAEDVTQSVFIHLAQNAPRLPSNVRLAGWLHRHTTFTAAKAIRSEQRRRKRELIATEMNALNDNASGVWDAIAPELDQSLTELAEEDREALVMRFLKQENLRAIGGALGISEDAAQKRVSRALEKLRAILTARGVAISAAALAATLETPAAAVAAPAGLIASVTSASVAAAGGTTAAVSVFKWMPIMNAKSVILGGLAAAMMVAPLVFYEQSEAQTRAVEKSLGLQMAEVKRLENAHEELLGRLKGEQSAAATPGAPDAEVLKLRGEVGRIRNQIREKKAPRETPPSRGEVVATLQSLYADRVLQVKQWLDAHPEEAVPELNFLTDNKWLQIVNRLPAEDANMEAQTMSRIRFEAQTEFANQVLQPALKLYAEANGGRFPTGLSLLKPFLKSEVDDAVLNRWEISRGTRFQLLEDEEWVITQKAPVNKALDERIFCGLRGVNGGGTNQWVTGP